MKGYVYMIDYYKGRDRIFADYDQIECSDKKDLLVQCRLLGNGYTVERIKLVNNNDRYIEKDISQSLYTQCKRILRNRLK